LRRAARGALCAKRSPGQRQQADAYPSATPDASSALDEAGGLGRGIQRRWPFRS